MAETALRNSSGVKDARLASPPLDRPPSIYVHLIALVAGVGGFLFGYDLVIISGANILLKEQFHLSDAAFGFTTSSAILGCLAGPLTGFWLCDRFGRKETLAASATLLAISAILTALPRDIIVFNIFRIVGGVGVGLASIASPMYIAEIAPSRIRGALGVMYQVAIILGALISAIVAYLLAKYLEPTVSWRWMFASELVPIAAFLVFLFFVPQSPRWLAEKGRSRDALRVLTRLHGQADAEKEMAEIVHSSASEELVTFSELLRPGMRRALLIGAALALFNNWTGWTAMSFYLPALFQKGGFPDAVDAIFQFLIVNFVMVLVTLVSLKLVDRVGRRPLWLVGSLMMALALILTGFVFQYNISGFVVLVVVFLCGVPHHLALGPLPWLMMPELYPTRLRARALAITTTVLWLAGFAGSAAFPVVAGLSERMLGSVSGAFFLYALLCVLSFVFGWSILPETKGRTLESIADSWTSTSRAHPR
jgi:SP family arabinose:H+ symporter-like MFS transporter